MAFVSCPSSGDSTFLESCSSSGEDRFGSDHRLLELLLASYQLARFREICALTSGNTMGKNMHCLGCHNLFDVSGAQSRLALGHCAAGALRQKILRRLSETKYALLDKNHDVGVLFWGISPKPGTFLIWKNDVPSHQELGTVPSRCPSGRLWSWDGPMMKHCVDTGGFERPLTHA